MGIWEFGVFVALALVLWVGKQWGATTADKKRYDEGFKVGDMQGHGRGYKEGLETVRTNPRKALRELAELGGSKIEGDEGFSVETADEPSAPKKVEVIEYDRTASLPHGGWTTHSTAKIASTEKWHCLLKGPDGVSGYILGDRPPSPGFIVDADGVHPLAATTRPPKLPPAPLRVVASPAPPEAEARQG